MARRAHFHFRIDQTGRPDDHLDDLARFTDFICRGRRRHVDDLLNVRIELVEGQRPIVECRRKPEAVLDQRQLARAVAAVHPVHLRQRHVRLVDHEQPVFGEEVEQTPGCRTGLASGQRRAVVLDAIAITDFAQHVEVVASALLEPLRLQQFALVLEEAQPLFEFVFDLDDRPGQLFVGRDVVLGRKDLELVLRFDVLAGQLVDDVDRFDLVAEELDSMDELFVDRDELERVAPHAERPAYEVQVVAAVLHPDQFAQERVAVERLADPDVGRHLHVVGRRAEPVDARNRRHDQRVGPGQQRLRGRVPQTLDLVVDRAVLRDVGIGVRDVRFGLIVVEVRDEILDRVVGEEIPELGAQLGRQRFVVAEHEGRLLHQLHDPGHRHRLARTRHA